MRKTPLRRSPIARGSGPRPTRIKRKPRKPSEFARIYGSKARVAWIKSLPCVVRSPLCAGEIENAHTVTGGMGRKADAATIVPLCHYHHAVLHQHGAASFCAFFGINLVARASATESAWLAAQAAA